MEKKILLTFALVFTPFTARASSVKSDIPKVERVVVIVFENTDFNKAMSQSMFATIATAGANLMGAYGLTHPSQPNYLALIGGETFGVKNDKNVTLSENHLGDLLEAAGKTWKVYADGYPGNCFLGSKSGKYARKHVPFLSFKNIQDSPSRCANIVSGIEWETDLQSGILPSFSLYVPDMSNDGHDTGVSFADKWLESTFMPSLKQNLPPNTLVIFTFDEGSTSGDNRIFTAFYGDMVVPGSEYSEKINHYGILHTIEECLGLKDLGKNDASSSVVTGIWK